MADGALVSGFTWVDGGVRLQLWTGSPRTSSARPLAGTIAFRVLPGRFCTGWHDGTTWQPCPDAATAVRGTTCEPCLRRDAFRPCLTCDGFRCPRLSKEMRGYCRQVHHLYLACFGDPTLKVGTASNGRRTQRVIEQGPLAAAVVASAEGPLIKQMEAVLSRAGFSETMRRSRKTALLRGAMTEQAASELVLEAAADLPSALPPTYHRWLHPPELVQQPALARSSRGLVVNELQIADDRVVEGRLVGAIGHLVFLDDQDGRFALDLGELKGRKLQFDPAGPRRRAQAQLGLF
jgi:Protein of unknown function (DUF2797)